MMAEETKNIRFCSEMRWVVRSASFPESSTYWINICAAGKFSNYRKNKYVEFYLQIQIT